MVGRLILRISRFLEWSTQGVAGTAKNSTKKMNGMFFLGGRQPMQEIKRFVLLQY